MPGRWAIRRDVFGKAEGEALRCFLPHAIVAEPGLRSIDQCVSMLLGEGETCAGGDQDQVILRNGQVVGHICITREKPVD